MKFSLCIAAYKDVFFEQCLQSLLVQDYDNFEIIILNDRSPGRIREISENVNHPKVFYYENEKNIGAVDLVDNWNKLLKLSTGDYIVIVGDDDYLSPNYLSSFRKLILSNPQTSVFHCRSYIVNERSEKIRLTNSWPTSESVLNGIYHRLANLRNWYISDFVYSVEALKAIGGFVKLPLAWASDDLTFYSVAAKGGVIHTEEPLFYYRESSFTISSSNTYVQKIKAVNLEYRLLKALVSNYQAQTEEEYLLKSLILKDLPIFFDRKRGDCIIQTLKNSNAITFKVNTVISLFRLRRKLSLKVDTLLKSILKSF